MHSPEFGDNSSDGLLHSRSHMKLKEGCKPGFVLLPRTHRVSLSKLTRLCARLVSEMDAGNTVSIEAVRIAIENEKVIAFIKKKLPCQHKILNLSLLDEEDEISLSENFLHSHSVLSPESLGINNNGLAWLLALTLEMISQQKWVSFN